MRKLPIFCMLVLFGMVFPATEISGCQALNSSNGGEYVVSADLHGASVNVSLPGYPEYACIVIEASNIVLDCNSHTLTSERVGYTIKDVGIRLNSSATNITVRNCVVSGYYCGICGDPYGSVVANSTLYENTNGISLAGRGNLVSGNEVHGGTYAISINRANDSIVANNEVYGNPYVGFFIDYSNGIQVLGNRDYGSHYSFDILSTNRSTIANNIVYNSTLIGFTVYSTKEDILENNTAVNSAGSGFSIQLSSANRFIRNNATKNSYGFYIISSSGDTFNNNVAYDNRNGGFFLGSIEGTILTGNMASENSDCGFTLNSSSGNTLSGNTASHNSCGIQISYSSGNTITGNNASGNRVYSILAQPGLNNTLSDNEESKNEGFPFCLFMVLPFIILGALYQARE